MLQDWWNATTIGDYWRLWNMPVHKWMLRHVYYPALRAGVPRVWAGTLVFAVSAFFHELLVGLPLHMVRCWAFIGVMAQVRGFF
jgi:diacylglycerol O-acyltransferase-1